jgi:integrase
MPTLALTDLSIRHLKPAPGKRVTYLDRTVKGFGIRVTENGQMSYVLTYGPNRNRIKLGDVGVLKLAQARDKARTILAERQLGVHQPKGRETYENAVELFLGACKAKNRPRTIRDYTRLLKRHGFGRERLCDIKPRDIQQKLDDLSSTPGEHAHATTALKIFFAFCVRRHLLDQSPMLRVEPPSRLESRSRVLSVEELKAIWNACDGRFGNIVRLCILTGQRRSEIAHLTAEMIEGDVIRLPASLTKNKREHLFPIGPTTAAIFATLPRTGYLFPALKESKKGSTVFNGWAKEKAKLDAASRISGWVLQDLRRTLVTNWAALGIRQEVTEKYINHVSGSQAGIVSVYQRHTFLPEMHEAVDKWERHLISLPLRYDPRSSLDS